MSCPRVLTALALLACIAGPASAGSLEEVILSGSGYDDVVAERASGERLRLDVRGCSEDMRGLVGRAALLWSPGAELAPESRLLIPEFNLSCRILRVDTLESARAARPALPAPEDGLRAARQALELLGYDCGRPGSEWSPEADQAFQRFRRSKGLDAGDQGLRRTVTALAMESVRGRQASGTGMRLARILTDQRDALARWLARPGSGGGAGCGETAWIRTVEGPDLTLSDRSRWEAVPAGRSVAATWSPGDAVTVCSGRMIHWPTGAMVTVSALAGTPGSGGR